MSGLEAFFFGSAATATTAATTGLFGTAGAFALAPTIGTVGGLMGAMGALQAGKADARTADYNAAIAQQEAVAEEARRRRESSRQIGAIRAARAKGGVTSEGTPMMVLAESAAMAELDALNARWQGQTQADLYRAKASSARRAIPYTVGASLLTTMGRAGTPLRTA